MSGAYATFDGVDSPLTQSFGLGLFEELSATSLDQIERFFLDRGAPINHEVSPLAGVASHQLLCERGYRPIEISSVLYQAVQCPASTSAPAIRVRLIEKAEQKLWAEVSARAWSHDHPELLTFLLESGDIWSARQDSFCFLAELDGVPSAAAALSIHDGVALFAGAATIPEARCKGLQAAMLQERMRLAFERGCDLAMMVSEVGSNSQRNAERKGFRIAYTRTKWQHFKGISQ